ncbi:MAG: type II CAAX prenyl endopeptidase Rce1 family protein [Sandaracinaceae bacterium]
MADRPIALSVAFYGGLSGLAGLIAAWRGQSLQWASSPWLGWPSPAMATGVSLALGAVLALVAVLGARWSVRRYGWARTLHVELRRLLGPLPVPTALAFALTSALGEELLFRGALQPWLGYVPASVLFGLLHVGPDRRFVPWTVQAVGMGFALGAIVQVSGVLWGAVLAHAVVNFVNLRFLASHDPANDDGAALPPSLVARRERRA